MLPILGSEPNKQAYHVAIPTTGMPTSLAGVQYFAEIQFSECVHREFWLREVKIMHLQNPLILLLLALLWTLFVGCTPLIWWSLFAEV